MKNNYIDVLNEIENAGTNSRFQMTCDGQVVDDLILDVSEQFSLNEEQQEVIQRLLDTLRFPENEANIPAVLVHGVFGSGKSTLVL